MHKKRSDISIRIHKEGEKRKMKEVDGETDGEGKRKRNMNKKEKKWNRCWKWTARLWKKKKSRGIKKPEWMNEKEKGRRKIWNIRQEWIDR